MTRSAPYDKSKCLGSWGSMVARLKLKEIDGRAPPGVNAVHSAPNSSPMKRVGGCPSALRALEPASLGLPARATPSTCGKLLKLVVTNRRLKRSRGPVNSLRDVTAQRDATMDDPQPSPYQTGCPPGSCVRYALVRARCPSGWARYLGVRARCLRVRARYLLVHDRYLWVCVRYLRVGVPRPRVRACYLWVRVRCLRCVSATFGCVLAVFWCALTVSQCVLADLGKVPSAFPP